MSLIRKLKRITLGRIEAFLDSLEDPAYIIPQLQKEISGKLDIAINAQAKALTSVKSDRRKLDELEGKLIRYDKLAQAAVGNDDCELARKVLAAQIQVEQDKQQMEQQLQKSEQAYLHAQQVCIQLKENLTELKQKHKELTRRDSAAKQMLALQKETKPPFESKSDSILDAVSRMEEKIIVKEAEVETRQDVSNLLLENDSFDKLERNAEVEQRLADLINQKTK